MNVKINKFEGVKLKNFSKILMLFLIFVLTVGCSKGTETNRKIELLLDWTPNTNHTGIFVAKELGFYEELGIEVEILNPPEDSATLLVASGSADLGISTQENLALALNEFEDFPVKAIAALIQHNTSGLISMKHKNIDSFKDLEGKKYATWGSKIEQETIRQVMENEGAKFEKVELYYSTVSDAISAIQTNVDSVWVYEAWDTIAAKAKGIEYNFLRFSDADSSLDYYTPILIANEEFLQKNEELTKGFLQATKKGYEYAINNPEKSAKILHKYAPEYQIEFLEESQKFLKNEYKSEVERWGYINPKRWASFFEWLHEKGIIENDNIKEKGFTNEYLPN